MPDTTEKIATPIKTAPLDLLNVEIYEHGNFMCEQFALMENNGVQCEISRSLSGLTLLVNRIGDPCNVAVLDLRPIATRMAEILLKENA